MDTGIKIHIIIGIDLTIIMAMAAVGAIVTTTTTIARKNPVGGIPTRQSRALKVVMVGTHSNHIQVQGLRTMVGIVHRARVHHIMVEPIHTKGYGGSVSSRFTFRPSFSLGLLLWCRNRGNPTFDTS
jgi:hypothetical protein